MLLSYDVILLLIGGVTFEDGVDGEVWHLAGGLTFSINQGADGPAGHGGVVTSGDAAR